MGKFSPFLHAVEHAHPTPHGVPKSHSTPGHAHHKDAPPPVQSHAGTKPHAASKSHDAHTRKEAPAVKDKSSGRAATVARTVGTGVVVTGAGALAYSAFTGVLTPVRDVASKAYEAVTELAQQLWSALSDAVAGGLESIAGFILWPLGVVFAVFVGYEGYRALR